jgi:hypothetical protein
LFSQLLNITSVVFISKWTASATWFDLLTIRSSFYGPLLLGLAYAHESSPKVLSLPIQKRTIQHKSQSSTERDANAISTSLFSDLTHGVYSINITIGTPGQPVSCSLILEVPIYGYSPMKLAWQRTVPALAVRKPSCPPH